MSMSGPCLASPHHLAGVSHYKRKFNLETPHCSRILAFQIMDEVIARPVVERMPARPSGDLGWKPS
jgi:hypothetical protein